MTLHISLKSSFESLVNSDRYQTAIEFLNGVISLRALLIQIGIKPVKHYRLLPMRLRALLIQIGIKLN